MRFEFDPSKSKTNKIKHGIDFIEVQAIWEDPEFMEIPARTTNEQRFLVIGTIAAKHWSCVITYRDEKIRIISARRARDEEIDIYEG